jgi:starch phosphorylase
LGTLDGANIEIRECVGEDNFYLFGLTEEEIQAKRTTYNPRDLYERSNYLKRILNALNSNMFCEKDYVLLFKPIFEELLNRDYYFVLEDLESFDKKMEEVEKDFLNREVWNKKAILNVARIGKFSSDRSIKEYAKKIWNIKPC